MTTKPPSNVLSFYASVTKWKFGIVIVLWFDFLCFSVAANGNFFYESVGFNATISPVPEPSTWAMMIFRRRRLLGFSPSQYCNARCVIKIQIEIPRDRLRAVFLFAVPELTRNANIKLNNGASLQCREL